MNRVVFAAVFGAAILLFSIDGSISAVADFLIPLTTSSLGISLFIVLCVVFVAISLVSFRLISETVSQTVAISKYFRIMYYIALVTQGSLICILFVILFQILTSSQYSTFLLSAATAIIASSSAVISAISSMILFGWYRVNRASYVALVFTVAFILSVYINIYLGTSHTIKLVEKPDYIRPDSEVIYPSDTYEPGTFNFVMRDVYRIASIGIFLLFLIASATMLHHYAAKIGRAKFWALIILPTVYYVSILVDTLGLYVPKSDTELFNYYLYVSLNGIIGGALLGFAFWSIAKAMKASKAVANYLRLCSYGFVLNFIAGVGTLVAAAYPPFGFVSFSMLTLSSYMIILGLYLTAVSISQDIKLRQFVKEVSKADTGFLSTISQAQMERQVQAKATDLEKVVKEQRKELEKESGIQSSMQQQDIKQYLLEVLQEVDKHKSAK